MTSQAAMVYTPAAKALYCSIVLLVTIKFVTALATPNIGLHTQPDTWISPHFFDRRADPSHDGGLPGPPPDVSSAAGGFAGACLGALRRLTHAPVVLSDTAARPLLGWASASAHRLMVHLFGLVTLPAIAAPRAWC
jgi:cytochrome b561